MLIVFRLTQSPNTVNLFVTKNKSMKKTRCFSLSADMIQANLRLKYADLNMLGI